MRCYDGSTDRRTLALNWVRQAGGVLVMGLLAVGVAFGGPGCATNAAPPSAAGTTDTGGTAKESGSPADEQLDSTIVEPTEFKRRILARPESGDSSLDMVFTVLGVPEEERDTHLYVWNLGDGTIVNSDSTRHTYSKPGMYAVRLDVFSPGGQLVYTISEFVEVALDPDDDESLVPFVVLIDGEMAYEGGAVALRAWARATPIGSGQTVSYEWSFADGARATGESVAHTLRVTDPYRVDVTATRSDGQTATSFRFFSLTGQPVPGGGGTAPGAGSGGGGEDPGGELVAYAGPDQTVESGAVVTLDGTGSTVPKTESVTYSWVQVGGPPVALQTADQPVATFTAPVPTDHALTLVFTLTLVYGDLMSSDTVATVVEPEGSGDPPVTDGSVRGAYLQDWETFVVPDLVEAGFNAFRMQFPTLRTTVPPTTHGYLDELDAELSGGNGEFWLGIVWCGIYELDWITGFDAYVTPTGQTMPNTPCPSDEVWWDRAATTRMVLTAEASLNRPALAGVSLDMEMYGADMSFYAGACMCDGCFYSFLSDRGYSDTVAATGRADWLAARGLRTAYDQAEEDRVAGLARESRDAVLAVNPDLRITGIMLEYPGPFYRGLNRGLSSDAHELLVWTELTYETGYDVEMLADVESYYEAIGVDPEIVSGINLTAIAPEALAGHLYTLGRHTPGYWIYGIAKMFGPEHPGPPLCADIEDYWAAIALAHEELDRYETTGAESDLYAAPFAVPLCSSGSEPDPGLVPAYPAGTAPQPIRFRRSNHINVYAEAGETIAIDVAVEQIGSSDSHGAWILYGPDGTMITSGTAYLHHTTTIGTTASLTGVYTIHLDTRGNTAEITAYSHPWAIRGLTGDPGRVALLQPMVPEFVYVPIGETAVSLRFTSDGFGEQYLVTIADGRQPDVPLFEGPIQVSRDVDLEIPYNPAGTWLEISATDSPDGTFEDVGFAVISGALPYVATGTSGLLRQGP